MQRGEQTVAQKALEFVATFEAIRDAFSICTDAMIAEQKELENLFASLMLDYRKVSVVFRTYAPASYDMVEDARMEAEAFLNT